MYKNVNKLKIVNSCEMLLDSLLLQQDKSVKIPVSLQVTRGITWKQLPSWSEGSGIETVSDRSDRKL